MPPRCPNSRGVRTDWWSRGTRLVSRWVYAAEQPGPGAPALRWAHPATVLAVVVGFLRFQICFRTAVKGAGMVTQTSSMKQRKGTHLLWNVSRCQWPETLVWIQLSVNARWPAVQPGQVTPFLCVSASPSAKGAVRYTLVELSWPFKVTLPERLPVVPGTRATNKLPSLCSDFHCSAVLKSRSLLPPGWGTSCQNPPSGGQATGEFQQLWLLILALSLLCQGRSEKLI